MKKIKYPIYLLLFIVLLSIFYFFYKNQFQKEAEPVFCTMEAKLCPDGSYVGRVGPDCEFAPCPGGDELGGFSSGFKNEHIEKSISNFLLAEEKFSWKTNPESINICSAVNLNPENELFPFYIWSHCGEYIVENDKLKELSGFSGPIKIDYPNEMSFYNLNLFSFESPRDGADNATDVVNIFPEDIQEKIFSLDRENIAIENKKIALQNILAWQEIKRAISDCEVELVSQSHSLEVSAKLKNGNVISAIEPKIDDIMKIVDKAKPDCGKIIMMTE